LNDLIAKKVNPSVISDFFDHDSYATSDGYSREDINLIKEAADMITVGWEDDLASLQKGLIN